MKALKKATLVGLMAMAIGGSAMAAPAQVGYLQVMGFENPKAEAQVNQQLAHIAKDFKGQVAALKPVKNFEGLGVMKMDTTFENKDVLNVGVETYVIKAGAAHGETKFMTILFDKKTGKTLNPAEVLQYAKVDRKALVKVVTMRAEQAVKQGAHINVKALEKKIIDQKYVPSIFFRADGVPMIYFQQGEVAPISDGMIVIPLPELLQMVQKEKAPVKAAK